MKPLTSNQQFSTIQDQKNWPFDYKSLHHKLVSKVSNYVATVKIHLLFEEVLDRSPVSVLKCPSLSTGDCRVNT